MNKIITKQDDPVIACLEHILNIEKDFEESTKCYQDYLKHNSEQIEKEMDRINRQTQEFLN